MADFPSPMPVDRDELTDLEGLEGATAALQPSSSTTMALPPSSLATSAPAKKKVISIEEYNHCKAAEWQLVTTYLDRDENGEDLDYEDFEPQDDPANIQISYWMPTPVSQIADLIGCHPGGPQCDYSNAPGQHWPRHRSGYYSAPCCH